MVCASVPMTSSLLLGRALCLCHTICGMAISCGRRPIDQCSLVDRLDVHLLRLTLGITPVIGCHALDDEAVGDAEDKEQPEEIERL